MYIVNVGKASAQSTIEAERAGSHSREASCSTASLSQQIFCNIMKTTDATQK
ncbi:hypothetical protein O9992_11950 [Vibrio lentus]|nr:hypothetical protein [Vibrio lentus]